MSAPSKSKILVKNTAWVYMGKVFSQLFMLIATVLVIRKLDVDMYGAYIFMSGLMVIFSLFSISPVVDVFNRYIPELIENGERNKFKKLLLIGIPFSIIFSVIIAVLIIVFKQPFTHFFNIENFEDYIVAFYAFVFANLFKLLLQSVLASLLLHKVSSMYLIISSLLRSALYVVLLKWLDVNLLLYIEAFVCLVYAVPGLIIVFRFNANEVFENKIPVNAIPVTSKRVLRFGLFTSLNQLGSGIVGRTSDFYIISAMSNLHNVGLYGFASRVYEMIFRVLPVNEFQSVLRPLFFQKFSGEHNPADLTKMYNFMVKVMFPVFAFPLSYFIVFGHEVIQYVFDPKYLAAYMVTCITLTDNVITAYFYPLAMVIQLKERMEIALISKIAVIFSLFAGIYFMKLYGIIGVAVATLAGNLIKNIIMFLPMRKVAKLTYNPLLFINYVLIFLVTGGAFYFMLPIINSMLMLVVFTIIYTIVNVLLIIVFNPFNKDERQYLDKIGDANKFTRKFRAFITRLYALPLIEKLR